MYRYIKINTRQFLTQYLHALAKLASAEGIEFSSLRGKVTETEIFASVRLAFLCANVAELTQSYDG